MMGDQPRMESLFYYFRLEDQIPENHRNGCGASLAYFVTSGSPCCSPSCRLA